MVRLLLIADDFTGALDTGVQFAARGAETCVVTDPAYDFRQADARIQVLVLDAETRHLEPAAAYDVVARAVRDALDAGFTHVYKKTDSALRGNVGAELTAALEASGAGSLLVFPAFPKMKRITRNGIHYIDGVPVAESVFGQDPFEPVCRSAVAEIVAQQSDIPVFSHRREDGTAPAAPGIHVYDAETDGDLARLAEGLGPEGLRFCAGCAGFAEALADVLGLNGEIPALPPLEPALFVACGSVNPVTLRQMQTAEEDGFLHIHLSPAQKLEPDWLDSGACREALEDWLRQAETGRCILDVNDPAGCGDTEDYARQHGLTTEMLRVGISRQLAQIMRRLLDMGLSGTFLCTGGDTLLALMKAVGVGELRPVREMAPGAVLTKFVYQGKTYHIISKSGGFGEPELFCDLAAMVGAGPQKEDVSC